MRRYTLDLFMNLDDQLAQLEDEQIIRRLDEHEPSYLFKHALLQQVAYDLLLKQDRRRLHRATAQEMEAFVDDFGRLPLISIELELVRRGFGRANQVTGECLGSSSQYVRVCPTPS